VLFVRLSSLGDVLDATPVAEAVKRMRPNWEVGWVADSRCAPLLFHNPYIDRVHVWDPTVRGSLRLWREVRSFRYTVAVDLQGLLKSAIVGWVSGASERLGPADAREKAGAFYTHRVEVKRRFVRVAERALTLLRGLNIEASPQQFGLTIRLTEHEQQAVEEWLALHNLKPWEYVVLAPATTTPQRHWLTERWAALADKLNAERGMRCVLLGGRSDEKLLTEVKAKAASSPVVSAGGLSVRVSCGVVGRAAAVVSLDSFLLHAGLAMGTSTIGLFGPTPTERFSEEPQLRIIERQLTCRPCGRRPTCHNEFSCMKMITVDDVMGELATVLSPLDRSWR